MQVQIDVEEVVKGLTHVVKDLLNPKFTVNNIYTNDSLRPL